MLADDPTTPFDADARRLALETIATLANIKTVAADHLLRPAGVPDNLISRFLTGIDATTNKALTKRQAGALILDELDRAGSCNTIVRKLIGLAAGWTGYHLPADEYKARAVVQKARELSGVLAEADERERQKAETEARQRVERQQAERDGDMRRQSSLLLAQFDHAAKDGDPQERGYFLQDLLNRTFDLHGVPVTRSFQRNGGGEQIDGAFEFDGWHYIVECRWRAKLADIRDLDGLSGQVARSGRQTMGMFVSVEGWSNNVVPLLKQNTDKSIILMDGYDLRSVLSRPFDLRALIKAKLRALNLEAEPFLSIAKVP